MEEWRKSAFGLSLRRTMEILFQIPATIVANWPPPICPLPPQCHQRHQRLRDTFSAVTAPVATQAVARVTCYTNMYIRQYLIFQYICRHPRPARHGSTTAFHFFKLTIETDYVHSKALNFWFMFPLSIIPHPSPDNVIGSDNTSSIFKVPIVTENE